MPFYTCGPNEALVVSGCCYSKPFYCAGGRVWVWPSIQQIQKISLTTMTLVVESPRVYTKKGVSVSVTGIAQVKISGQNKEMLAHACQLFLGKSEREIAQISLETMEGHQRAIMGLMTVEEIYQDRQKFAEKVFEVASSDLLNMGIAVVSYVLKDVRDEEHYLQSLGMSRTAEVKRDARIGEAEANKDAKIREALADEKRLAARYNNDVGIAKAKRDYELCQAEYDQQVQAQKAVADLSYSLQAAKIKQKIKEEEMQVKVVERTQAILLQEQEIQRRQKELDATIKRPAEAEKFKAETLAEAERQQIILAAQADAEAIKMRGEAEAFAIETKAKAEAEQMAKKAEAWKEYKNAAMVDMFLDVLPKVAAEVAAPFTEGVKQITMVSTGKGEMGAAKLTGELMDIVTSVPAMVSKMTGVDLTQKHYCPRFDGIAFYCSYIPNECN
uniref:Band 7 domain-containing protein n=1 Tax=Romanomermis culicivorax TaxID=13658 RepID=A0A915KTK8_ROMCU